MEELKQAESSTMNSAPVRELFERLAVSESKIVKLEHQNEDLSKKVLTLWNEIEKMIYAGIQTFSHYQKKDRIEYGGSPGANIPKTQVP